MKTKNITLKWLEDHNACSDGVEWFKAQSKKNEVDIINDLIKDDELDWANWTVARRLPSKDRIRYAIYAAGQVLALYENKHPSDNRPRLAIRAARAYLKNPSTTNKNAAANAAYAAYAATDAADAAYAAYAAYAAADAAYAATHAAYATADAAADAADAATHAAYAAADAAMKIKILKYGIKLLKK